MRRFLTVWIKEDVSDSKWTSVVVKLVGEEGSSCL